MKTKNILKHTLREIKRLKKHATPEQLDNLDFDKLDPGDNYKCIYGQMTGNCDNTEALYLFDKCARRIVTDFLLFEHKESKVDKTKKDITNYSILEVFIYHFDENNEDIINYLKGDSKGLVLELEGEYMDIHDEKV